MADEIKKDDALAQDEAPRPEDDTLPEQTPDMAEDRPVADRARELPPEQAEALNWQPDHAEDAGSHLGDDTDELREDLDERTGDGPGSGRQPG